MIKHFFANISNFRVVFMMILSFGLIAMLDDISLIFLAATMIWGLILLFLNFKKYATKTALKWPIWVFLGLMLATSLLHIVNLYSLGNFVIILFMMLCFFVFYGIHAEKTSKKNFETEMVLVFKFLAMFGAICGTASILVLIAKIQINFSFLHDYSVGILGNRLIGIYTNSNLLAFSMIAAIFACDVLNSSYFRNRETGFWSKKWLYLVILAICCTALFLSDSNTSFLFLIIYTTIRIFCKSFLQNDNNDSKKPTYFLRGSLLLLGFCSVTLAISLFLRGKTQEFFSDILTDWHGSNISTFEKFDESNSSESTVPPEDFKEFHFGRENYEISSGRIPLFIQGLKIFAHHPMLGIGRMNLQYYGQKYLPNGLLFYDLHNAYLTVLVCNGALGLAIFAIFGLAVIYKLCKHLLEHRSDQNYKIFTRLFAFLVAYSVCALFEQILVFNITFMVVIFWLVLGYAFEILQNRQIEEM